MIEQGSTLIAYERSGLTHEIILGKRLGKPGGEGAAYETNIDGQVAKIFALGSNGEKSKATENKYLKIKELIESGISYPGICFPRMMLTTKAGEFVGYTMDRAKGDPLQEVINPMVIRDDFPNMKRVDLVQICIDILEKIVFLHNNGIVLCDINLGNILVDGITQGKPMTYFIDTDSYQLGDLLGEVGVDIFTPPELHGKDLGKIKRTFENEYFSVSTLLFMIVMPGQKPYARIGGTGSVAENIRTGIFPYAKGGEYSGEYAPNIIYRHIWSHLAYKNHFWESFHKKGTRFEPNSRISASEWLKNFKHYRQLLTDGTIADEDPEGLLVFPQGYKRTKKKCAICDSEFLPNNPNDKYCDNCKSSDEELVCANCKNTFVYTAEQQRKDQQSGADKPELCPRCNRLCGTCATCGKLFTREFKGQEKCEECSAETLICTTCGNSFVYTLHAQMSDHGHGNPKPQECYSCRTTKLCPVCHAKRIPKSHSYCDGCREKPAEYRECVNCHKKFPVSHGLKDWERRKGYTRKQCDICKAAHCKADPCCHSEAYQQRQRELERQRAAASQKPSTNSKSEGCYIATCVYGSYSHPNTVVLRTFRDRVLKKHHSGRAFIRLYYAVSPKLVSAFGRCAPITTIWRLLLDKMVTKINERYDF